MSLQYTPGNEQAVIKQCLQTLSHSGSVLLIPTETVYGLVCRWDDEAARNKIYQLKHRNPNKLLAMFAPDMESAVHFGAKPSALAVSLFQRFTPGGITIICESAEGGTVGVRVPDHPLILQLLKALNAPLASTSANLSGSPAALNLGDGLKSLSGAPDLAVDGGALPMESLASTVVDATGTIAKIIRAGAIPASLIFAEKSEQN